MTASELQTHRHIARVNALLGEFACELIRRGAVHDQSKFDPVEAAPLEEMQKLIDAEGQAPYGSEGYKRRTAMLGPMLEHHYANNSHHPEHYADGVAGMDLFDLVEMFLDWKAASERGDEPAMNLTHSFQRFGISGPLASILRNTANRLDFKHK